MSFNNKFIWLTNSILLLGLIIVFSTISSAQTIDVKVAHSKDDAEERASDGGVLLTSTDLDMFDDAGDRGIQSAIGYRFRTGVNIPVGSTINSAYIEFTVEETRTNATDITIYGEDEDNSSVFSTTGYDVSSRNRTTETVAWNSIPIWNVKNEKKQTPELKTIVQEIIDRGGWASGNAMSFILMGSGRRVVFSYDRGQSAKYPRLVIDYTAPPPTIDVIIQSNSDDAEEDSGGNMDLNDNDLEMAFDGSNQEIGLRFSTGIDIPAGSIIGDAYIEFTSMEVQAGATSLTIKGEDIDNSTTFTTTNSNISSRTTTTASVAWTPAAWPSAGASFQHQTANIKTIVQEIFARPGWTSGNAMTFVITGTGERVAVSKDNGTDFPARLVIEYNPPEIFYACKDGDWNDASTWSKISPTGATCSEVPSSIDSVIIDGWDVTMNSQDNTIATIKLLIDDHAGQSTLTIQNGKTLTVNGDVFVSNLISNSNNMSLSIENDLSTLNIGGDLEFDLPSNYNDNRYIRVYMTDDTELNLSGAFTYNMDGGKIQDKNIISLSDEAIFNCNSSASIYLSSTNGHDFIVSMSDNTKWYVKDNLLFEKDGKRNLTFNLSDNALIDIDGDFTIDVNDSRGQQSSLKFNLFDDANIRVDGSLDFDFREPSANGCDFFITLNDNSIIEVGVDDGNLTESATLGMSQNPTGWHTPFVITLDDKSKFIVYGDMNINSTFSSTDYSFYLDINQGGASGNAALLQIDGDFTITKSNNKKMLFRLEYGADIDIGGDFLIDVDGAAGTDGDLHFLMYSDAKIRVGGSFNIDFDEPNFHGSDIILGLNDNSMIEVGLDDGNLLESVNISITANKSDWAPPLSLIIEEDAQFIVYGDMDIDAIFSNPDFAFWIYLNVGDGGTADDNALLQIDGNLTMTKTNCDDMTIMMEEGGFIDIGGDFTLDINSGSSSNGDVIIQINDSSKIRVDGSLDINFDEPTYQGCEFLLHMNDNSIIEVGLNDGGLTESATIAMTNNINDWAETFQIFIEENSQFIVYGDMDISSTYTNSDFGLKLYLNVGDGGTADDAALIQVDGNLTLTKTNNTDFSFFMYENSDVIVGGDLTILASASPFTDSDFGIDLNDNAVLDVNGSLDITFNESTANSDFIMDVVNSATITVGIDSDNITEHCNITFTNGNDADIYIEDDAVFTVFGDLDIIKAGGTANDFNVDIVNDAHLIVYDDFTLNNSTTNTIKVDMSPAVSSGTEPKLTVFQDIDFTSASAANRVEIEAGDAAIITIGGNFLRSAAPDNFGLLDADGASCIVNYNGTAIAQTFAVDGAETFRYDNVYFNNTSGSGVTLGGNITTTNVLDDVRTQSGLAITGGDTTTINATKTFEVANDATWRTNTSGPTGGLSTGGYQSIGATSTVDFYGDTMTVPVLLANSSAAQQDYGIVLVRGTGIKTLAGDESVVTLCNISASVLDCGTNTWNGAGALIKSAGEIRMYKTAVVLPELTGRYTITGGLANFIGAGIQSLRGDTFHNVAVDGNGIKTLDNDIDINGYLRIDTSAVTLDAGTNRTINLAGNWTNNGIFTPQSGDVIFDGAGAQIISGDSATVLYDLTIKNNGNTVTMNNDVSLSNQLDFSTSGFIDIDTSDLTITGWVDGCIPNLATDRYVIVDSTGYMKITDVSDTETAIFPIGLSSSSTDFARVDIDNNDAANTSFDVNICTYVNMEGTCSGGTQITTDGVGRTWNIVSSSTDATVGLYWDTSKEVGTFDNTDCAVTHHNGTKWKSLAATAASTNYSCSIYYVAGPTTSFSPFTVGDGILLPIELLTFNADWQDNSKQQAIITWATASEINNDYFEIQRSTDATNWETIGEELGAGNSSSMIDYSFIDYSPENGVSYYRLKQTDFDGRYEYSETKSIAKQEKGITSFKIFPNPTSNLSDTKLQIDGFTSNKKIQMVIQDVYGRTIYSRDITTDDFGRTIRTIDPQNMLSSGTYFVIVTSGETIHTQKLNVQL